MINTEGYFKAVTKYWLCCPQPLPVPLTKRPERKGKKKQKPAKKNNSLEKRKTNKNHQTAGKKRENKAKKNKSLKEKKGNTKNQQGKTNLWKTTKTRPSGRLCKRESSGAMGLI